MTDLVSKQKSASVYKLLIAASFRFTVSLQHYLSFCCNAAVSMFPVAWWLSLFNYNNHFFGLIALCA